MLNQIVELRVLRYLYLAHDRRADVLLRGHLKLADDPVYSSVRVQLIRLICDHVGNELPHLLENAAFVATASGQRRCQLDRIVCIFGYYVFLRKLLQRRHVFDEIIQYRNGAFEVVRLIRLQQERWLQKYVVDVKFFLFLCALSLLLLVCQLPQNFANSHVSARATVEVADVIVAD